MLPRCPPQKYWIPCRMPCSNSNRMVCQYLSIISISGVVCRSTRVRNYGFAKRRSGKKRRRPSGARRFPKKGPIGRQIRKSAGKKSRGARRIRRKSRGRWCEFNSVYTKTFARARMEFADSAERSKSQRRNLHCHEIYERRSIYRPTGSRTSDYRCLKSADAIGLVRARVIGKRSWISLASAKLPLHPPTENSTAMFFFLINWWNCKGCRFEVAKLV